jgi:probable selenium-dependent hydroxylase accessory protein YqeC
MIRNRADAARAPLWRALALHEVPRPVVAIVGAGGKTSLLFALAREVAGLGGRAVVTGSTRFTPAPHGWPMPVKVAARAGEAARLAAESGVNVLVVTGVEPQPAGRLAPLAVEDIDALAGVEGFDATLVEADGSRARAFKAPGEREPVIPPSATHVIAVVGASALGQPLDGGAVHRPERVRALVPGLARDALCSAEIIARVLVHDDGGRRGASGRAFAVVVNQADTHPEAARAISAEVRACGVTCALTTALRDSERPVRGE